MHASLLKSGPTYVALTQDQTLGHMFYAMLFWIVRILAIVTLAI